MFVNLQIKSKNQNSLKKFLKIFLKLNNFKKLKLKNIFKLFLKKNHRTIFTILKSPHVNKVSQEQFEFNISFIQVNLTGSQIFKLLMFLKKIQVITGFDVNINIKFVLNSKLVNLSKIPKQVSCKDSILFLDFYGNYNF